VIGLNFTKKMSRILIEFGGKISPKIAAAFRAFCYLSMVSLSLFQSLKQPPTHGGGGGGGD
jgi:hypothetical protein